MPFDKFEARCAIDWESAYAKKSSDWWRHHQRFKLRVQKTKLTCQECGGAGGEIEPVTDYGQGPFIDCGWCEGTGLMTPWLRGQWLKCKREERRIA